MNIQIDKLDSDRNTPRMFVPQQFHTVALGSDMYGQTTNRSEARTTINMERNTPDTMSALRSNPYAQSIV
jgi:hypothetical protein